MSQAFCSLLGKKERPVSIDSDFLKWFEVLSVCMIPVGSDPLIRLELISLSSDRFPAEASPFWSSEAAEWRWAHMLLQHRIISETSGSSVFSGQGEQRRCHKWLSLSYSKWQKCGKVLEEETVASLSAREALCSSLSLFMMKLHSLITSLSVDQWLSPVTTKIALLVQLPCKGHALLISWGLAIHFAVPY